MTSAVSTLPVYNNSDSSPNGYFNEMSSEVVIHVLHYLDIRDLGRISLVSQRFCVLQNMPSLWKHQAERISSVSFKEHSFICESLQFDFNSLATFTLKDQVKNSMISFPEMKIFPNWEATSKLLLTISKKGLVKFTTVLPKEKYIPLAVKAITYLSENNYIHIWSTLSSDEHTYVYKKDQKVVCWHYECDIHNYMNRPSDSDQKEIDLILTDRIETEVSFPPSTEEDGEW
jgi:F-box-like